MGKHGSKRVSEPEFQAIKVALSALPSTLDSVQINNALRSMAGIFNRDRQTIKRIYDAKNYADYKKSVRVEYRRSDTPKSETKQPIQQRLDQIPTTPAIGSREWANNALKAKAGDPTRLLNADYEAIRRIVREELALAIEDIVDRLSTPPKAVAVDVPKNVLDDIDMDLSNEMQPKRHKLLFNMRKGNK